MSVTKNPTTLRLAIVLMALSLLSPSGARAAADHVVPLSRTEAVSGVPVRFDGSVTYTIPEKSCAPIPLRLVVSLDDLNAKLTRIIKASKVERQKPCGERLTVDRARMWADGGHLSTRAEGAVGWQQCAKVMHKAVVLTTLHSGIGVEAAFQPRIEANRLHMDLVGKPRLEIADETLADLLKTFDPGGKLDAKLAEVVQTALNKPKAALQLPTELAGFTFTFDTARIDMVDGHLSLVVTGTSPRNQALMPKFFGYLGAPAQAACQ
jgi:hypothetical protein